MYEKYIKKAEQIATLGHSNDVRDGGLPFITHPAAIVKMISSGTLVYKNIHIDLNLNERCKALVLCASWLHDLFEDHPDLYKLTCVEDLQELFGVDKDDDFFISLYAILKVLTKKKNTRYVDYIYDIKHGPLLAEYVKIADLIHNSSDLPGKRIDKYELALLLLTGQL